MQTDSEKINDVSAVTEPQADTLFKSVLQTSFKTIVCLFLLMLLSATYFFMRFPYHAMKLYMDFSMHESALTYCERAVNVLDKDKHADKLNESLVNGVELSSMLLIDTGELKYARKLIKFTQLYAVSPQFDEVNSRLDEFYLSQIVLNKGNVSIYNSLSLYSYKDFVYSSNAYARVLLNQADKMLFGGVERFVVSITHEELAALGAHDLAVFFNQAAFCPTNAVYGLTAGVIGGYLDAVKQKSGIEQLYLLRAADNIAQSLKGSFGDREQEIEDAFRIQGQTINDYFNEKLEQFR